MLFKEITKSEYLNNIQSKVFI